MTSFTAIKDPEDIEQYSIDWSDWLNGSTISASTWTVSGQESPCTMTKGTTSNTTTTTTVLVSGGTGNRTYILTNHVTTASSPQRQADQSIAVKVRQA